MIVFFLRETQWHFLVKRVLKLDILRGMTISHIWHNHIITPKIAVKRKLRTFFYVYVGMLLWYLERNSINLRMLSKKYSIIDQQIARHFVHYIECLYPPPSLLWTQINNPCSLLTLNQPRKRVVILANREILILVPLV